MPTKSTKKSKKYTTVPGITVECKSGRYLAFYDHRTDIIANGDNEVEAKKNLKEMYDTVIKHEKKEEEQNGSEDLPTDFKIKRFKDKVSI